MHFWISFKKVHVTCSFYIQCVMPCIFRLDCSQSSIFSVRSSRSRALRYALPILHECQNYLGGGGGLGESEKNSIPKRRWKKRKRLFLYYKRHFRQKAYSKTQELKNHIRRKDKPDFTICFSDMVWRKAQICLGYN